MGVVYNIPQQLYKFLSIPKIMKFAHMADCHLGGWRDPKMRTIGEQAFERAIDKSIEEKVDFVIIAGDLFNTSLPPIESLKIAVKKLKDLKDKEIPAYIISGSHDFSPSGKTMLDILESAGLVINVAKGEDVEGKLKLNFTIDQKTGTKLTGLPGKRLGLDKSYYEQLVREHLENEPGYKIFLFHAVLEELKPKFLEKVDGMPSSLMPKNFNYYAGGHVHIVKEHSMQGYEKIVYPGPLFPNSFSEIEELGCGGFYIVENNIPTFHQIQVYNITSLQFDAEQKTPDAVNKEILDTLAEKEFINTIITLRIAGTLATGKPSDINYKKIYAVLQDKGAHVVMKNTNKLTTKEFEEIKIDVSSVEEVEEKLIKEHLGQIKVDSIPAEKEKDLTKDIMHTLQTEKLEGEKVADFEKRIKDEMEKVLHL